MAETLADQYAKLDYQQKVIFSGLVRKELADSVLVAVRRLVKVAEHSKNDAAAVAASRQLLLLAEKKRILQHDPLEELQDELMNAISQDAPVP